MIKKNFIKIYTKLLILCCAYIYINITNISFAISALCKGNDVQKCSLQTLSTEPCPPNQECQILQTSGNSYGFCAPAGKYYCQADSDCTSLNATKCMTSFNIGSLPFNAMNTSDGVTINSSTLLSTNNNITIDNNNKICLGQCTVGGNYNDFTQDNTFSYVICNGIAFITGSAGRAVMAAIVCIIGMLFLAAKVNWIMIVTMGIGLSTLYGATQIVTIITGVKFTCER